MTDAHLSPTPSSSRPTSRVDVPPAGDPGVGAVVEGAVGGCQTHRQDEIVEGDGRRQLQQADVVVRVAGVVVGMVDDLRYGARHLVGVSALLLLAAQVQRQGAGYRAGRHTQHNTT